MVVFVNEHSTITRCNIFERIAPQLTKSDYYILREMDVGNKTDKSMNRCSASSKGHLNQVNQHPVKKMTAMGRVLA